MGKKKAVTTINGVNKSIYNCIYCNKKLTQDEYYSCEDMCTDCRINHYDKINRIYIGKDGSNNIDAVLIKKFIVGDCRD